MQRVVSLLQMCISSRIEFFRPIIENFLPGVRNGAIGGSGETDSCLPPPDGGGVRKGATAAGEPGSIVEYFLPAAALKGEEGEKLKK